MYSTGKFHLLFLETAILVSKLQQEEGKVEGKVGREEGLGGEDVVKGEAVREEVAREVAVTAQ